jgi:acyl-coenzyme A synthetase/AMP-(fatty) acid ligase
LANISPLACLQLSIVFNALHRHILEGNGDRVALYYDNGYTGYKESVTYKQLQEHVHAVAETLASFGVGKGDTVLVYVSIIFKCI